MKVLLTKKFHDTDVNYIEQQLDEGIELVHPATYDEDGVLTKISGVDVLFGGLLTSAIIENSSGIQFAQIPWTGIDNLNFEALSKAGLVVCNSHSNATVVAEHAVSLAFAVAKKIPFHDRQMRLGNWNRLKPGGNVVSPFSAGLSNCAVTYIGFGAINSAVNKLLTGFNPRVCVVNRSGTLNQTDSDIAVFPIDKLEDAVSSADFVFVSVPLTAQSEKLITDAVFDSMPTSSILINISRGAVIDEQALYTALKNDIIAGAGIDTWYNYPAAGQDITFPSKSYSFESLENIVMSPHRAGYVDSGFPHLDDAISNLNRSKRGQPLINTVSTSLKY